MASVYEKITNQFLAFSFENPLPSPAGMIGGSLCTYIIPHRFKAEKIALYILRKFNKFKITGSEQEVEENVVKRMRWQKWI